MNRHRLLGIGVALATLTTGWAAPSGHSAAGPIEWFHFRDPRILESSGVATSSTRADVIYTHNDSGDSARFFAVRDDGCTLATYNLAGARAVDWEDVGRGADGLWFADIGDNEMHRTAGIWAYHVTEPVVTEAGPPGPDGCPPIAEFDVPWTKYPLAYLDGYHDAETLLVHPVTGRLYVVSKLYGESTIYAAPATLQTDAVNTLTPVAAITVPPVAALPGGPGFALPNGLQVTGGDIAPDGYHVVLRTYSEAYEWEVTTDDFADAFSPFVRVWRIDLPHTVQGEGIAYTRAGDAVVTTTEGLEAPVHLIPRG